MRTAVVLFTRDLRVHDNHALSTAAREAERIVPLFVFDDAILGSAFARPNRVAFLLDALRDLHASLTPRGARLVLRSGDVVAETLAVARNVGAEEVLVTEDASAYAQRRQQRLEHACRGDRVALRVTPGVTVAPLQSIETSSDDHYSVFTPFYRAWSSAPRRPVESCAAAAVVCRPALLARQAARAQPPRRRQPVARASAGRRDRGPAAALHVAARRRRPVSRPVATTSKRTRRLAACRRTSTSVAFRRWKSQCELRRSPVQHPSCANLRGATSSTNCSPRDRRRRTRTCVRAVIDGAASARRSRRGRTARPATRSSTPACDSFCARGTCTTALG